jgi:signal transduction histidine kinase
MGGNSAESTDHAVRLHDLPVGAIVFRGDRAVAMNAACESFTGRRAEEIVGRSIEELIGEFVKSADLLTVEDALGLAASRTDHGQVWCNVRDPSGVSRPIRVEWRPGGAPEETVVFLIDAAGEALSRNLAEGLARAAGELVRCRHENEVLERAADALLARGLIVTTLLLREDDPLLEYGPMRSPLVHYDADVLAMLQTFRPRREVLEQLNPGFHKRRAIFFQDLAAAVAKVYPPDLAERIKTVLPTRRTVQAPLFVDDRPFGAIVVTGDLLTPAMAGSVEMFAELVARAIETVRLRVELVQRERLAALGEAAAVMAHEVRNPIAAILNAGALLRRFLRDAAGTEADLVRVIAEEAARLNRLVKDLLDLGRPLAPTIRPVDLGDLARRTLGVLRDRNAFGEVPIRVESPATPVVAAIDPELVQLALGNVVLNAVQASPAGGTVTLTITERGASSAVVVDDEGSGFPREASERVLEPFYTTRATGTGIGLAVVRRVIEACTGDIEFGRSPKGGGRVVLVFPRPAQP